jgi:hypothetical protein
LAGYYDSEPDEFREVLQERINLLERRSNRITRVPNSKWLFIFGPAGKTKNRGAAFLVFTLVGTGLEQLIDDDPLRPSDWAG